MQLIAQYLQNVHNSTNYPKLVKYPFNVVVVVLELILVLVENQH
jgi:hypothetical protein